MIDLAQEYGLDITSPSANEAGWWECRAFDRVDNRPSASISERTGAYHDFATSQNIDFFELAVRLGAYEDTYTAIDDLGSQFCTDPTAFADEMDWPELEPLRERLLPVPSLDPAMIPAPSAAGWST